MTPSYLVIFLKRGLLWISSGLEVMLGYFCFADFSVLELSRDNFTKFGVLEFFWDRQNSPFLWIGSAQIFHACYFWFLTWLEVAVPVFIFIQFSRSFSFRADAVLFLFLFCFSRKPCRFFSCFVWSNPICWHLKLLARALVSDVFFSLFKSFILMWSRTKSYGRLTGYITWIMSLLLVLQVPII